MVATGQFAFLHYLYSIHISIATADSIISTLYLSLSVWGLMQAIRIYPTRVGVTLYSLLVALFFGLATVFLSTKTIAWWTNADELEYLQFLQSSLPVRYVVYWLVCSLAAVFIALSKSIEAQERQFKEHSDASALLKEAELFKLRQQLQPHFLYNSLNSISALTLIDASRAQEMIGLLSDFLRQSVQREAKQQVALEDELEYLQKYLAIEAIRFGDRLQVAVHADKNITGHIPPFLLQPLLENAIKFGLYGNTGAVIISIDISRQNDIISITITNPVHTDTQTAGKGTGFGITGVQRRLQLLYNRNDLLESTQNESTFTTKLKIPQEYA